MPRQQGRGILESISISYGEAEESHLKTSSSDEFEVKLIQSTEYDYTMAEEDADKIIQEARNAVAYSFGENSRDERKERIIQEAKKELSTRRTTKLRSTDEVLLLAGKVLSKENGAPQNLESRDSSPNNDQSLCPSSVVSDSGCSIDEYDRAVTKLAAKFAPESPSLDRDEMLKKIDGFESTAKVAPDECSSNPCNLLEYIWGPSEKVPDEHKQNRRKISFASDTMDDKPPGRMERPMSPLPPTPTSSFFNSSQSPPSYAETINAAQVDTRMPGWVNQHTPSDKYDSTEDKRLEEPGNGYYLGTSKTIVIHEVVRGSWTWGTTWSPDGSRLAVATENHNIAVVDTASSTVWRVRHDKRIFSPARDNPTNTIRTLAWGSQFIAAGGTGNCVTIFAPSEPYPMLHTIKNTGYVGSLDWKVDSAVLAVGSREDKCMVFSITATDGDDGGPLGRGRQIESTLLHTLQRSEWANCVAFSPGGTVLAVGDQGCKLALYSYEHIQYNLPKVEKITSFSLHGAVLSLEWSPDGKWLYAGGEDFAITIIDTSSWQIIHTIDTDRWVQFIASSHGGSHVAVGGGTSEVAILDANAGWKPVMKIQLKGLVPLSAKWHPKDQFLVLTGQNNSVIAVETTPSRLVKGFYLFSTSPIQSVAFAPDSLMAAVGNEGGVVSFYTLSGSTFVTAYEMVLADSSSQSILWSPDGKFAMVGSARTLAIVGMPNSVSHSNAPPNTSGFAVRRVIRHTQDINSVSIHPSGRYIALGGETCRILDVEKDFCEVIEWDGGEVLATAWSPDRKCLATIGLSQELKIYDVSSEDINKWESVLTLQADGAGLAIAWAPVELDGLQYLAFGGGDKKVTIIEFRSNEKTWETVLEVERPEDIFDLDWNINGLLAVAVGDGTVTLIDLGYLQSGWAVNEMDYNWQRQGITCFTEIRRSQGKNSMRTARWMPPRPGDTSNFLAIGGTDGALEVVDMTERQRCRGFSKILQDSS